MEFPKDENGEDWDTICTDPNVKYMRTPTNREMAVIFCNLAECINGTFWDFMYDEDGYYFYSEVAA